MRRLVLLLALAAMIPLASAQQASPRDAVEYVPVTPPVPTSTGERIEVVELFWYGCPHCYRLEPYVERWLEAKPDEVAFVRIPAVFDSRPVWGLHARVYYAMELLGVLERLHRRFFDAIHAQRIRLNKPEQVVAWFADQGVDGDAFRDALNSFAVSTKFNRARQLTRRYGIDGVPSLIVEGQYRTGPSLAGSYAKTMPVIEGLVEMVREERQTAGK